MPRPTFTIFRLDMNSVRVGEVNWGRVIQQFYVGSFKDRKLIVQTALNVLCALEKLERKLIMWIKLGVCD